MTLRHTLRPATALAALILTVAPAFAHSHPKVMLPEKDAIVSAPKEVSVIFTEALEPKFSSLTLVDDKGTVVSKAPSVLDPADAKHLTLPLPTLAPGLYHVKWTTSATDGHKMSGDYTFTVK
jgi:methionine-rich copper-binding protein CopC